MSIVYLVLIGAVAGYIATRLLKLETDILTTVAIGISGALLGGFILQVVLALAGLLGGVIGAIFGALLLIWLYQKFITRRK